MQNRTKGNIALLIAAFIWGSGFLAQKIGMAYIGPFLFNGSRQIIAALVLLPYGVRIAGSTGYFSREKFSAETVDRHKHDLIRSSLICGFFLTVGTNLQQIGLMTVSAGKSGFITSIYISFVPLFGMLLGDRVSVKIWGCILTAMAGFAMLSLHGDLGSVSLGDILTLLSSVAFACQMIAVNRLGTRNNAIMLSIGQMMVCGTLSLLIAAFTERPGYEALTQSTFPILYSALIPTAIGFTLQIIGQKHTDPSLAALILSLEAVFAAFLGAVILQEHMTARELLGCLLILAATVVASLPDRRPEEKPR